jgi:hypothetical protein
MTDITSVIAALEAEPEGKVFRSPAASDDDVASFERDTGLAFPDDVRRLLAWSNGVGVARSPVGFYMPSLAGLRRLNSDELYTEAFPEMLLIGDDGASGLFVIDAPGRTGHGVGAVLLTDRGSLRQQDTVVAGQSVTEVLDAVLAREDLWRRPHLTGGEPS